MKYIKLSDWKKREFKGRALDNRTIKKYIANGRLVGIIEPWNTHVREDQTIEMVSEFHEELSELIGLSA